MANKTGDLKPKKSRLRISLRWLLVLFLLIQLPLVYVYYMRDRVAREERALKLLVKGKGTFQRGHLPLTKQGWPDHRRKRPAQEYFANVGLEEELYLVTELRLQGEFDDRLQHALADLPQLEVLTFHRCSFTSDARLPAGGLPKLKEIYFAELTLSKAMLESIGAQASVAKLGLDSCELPECPKYNGKLKEDFFKHDPNASGDAAAFSAQFKNLRRMRNLQSVSLSNQSYAGAIIVQLPPNVRRVRGLAVHVGEVPRFSKAPELGLEEVDLESVDVSKNELRDLLRHCPKMKLVKVSSLDTLAKQELEHLQQSFPCVRFQEF